MSRDIVKILTMFYGDLNDEGKRGNHHLNSTMISAYRYRDKEVSNGYFSRENSKFKQAITGGRFKPIYYAPYFHQGVVHNMVGTGSAHEVSPDEMRMNHYWGFRCGPEQCKVRDYILEPFVVPVEEKVESWKR